MRKRFLGSRGFPLLALLLIGPAHAEAGSPLSGGLLQYSEPTSPFDLVHGVGASPTPELEGNEIGDAFGQFADPRRAMEVLESIKRAHRFTGGRVYAGFTYKTGVNEEFRAELGVTCGVSRSGAADWGEVRERAVASHTDWRGLFRAFKLADRPARVRAIARCLKGLSPEMPPLKPARPRIKRLYIDDKAYEMGVAWLRSREPAGLPAGTLGQYKAALRCMVTRAAETYDATGTDVVVRAPRSQVEKVMTERSPILPGSAVTWDRIVEVRRYERQDLSMAVVNEEAVDFVWDIDEPSDAEGLWDFRMGFDDMIFHKDGVRTEYDRFMMIFDGALHQLPECRRRAGLFELPDTRLPRMGAEGNCAK